LCGEDRQYGEELRNGLKTEKKKKEKKKKRKKLFFWLSVKDTHPHPPSFLLLAEHSVTCSHSPFFFSPQKSLRAMISNTQSEQTDRHKKIKRRKRKKER
jgi:hypothetical protein